jgi:hypothetical protein
MSPLARVIAINLLWRFGVQVPTFMLYRLLSR